MASIALLTSMKSAWAKPLGWPVRRSMATRTSMTFLTPRKRFVRSRSVISKDMLPMKRVLEGGLRGFLSPLGPRSISRLLVVREAYWTVMRRPSKSDMLSRSKAESAASWVLKSTYPKLKSRLACFKISLCSRRHTLCLVHGCLEQSCISTQLQSVQIL